MVTKRYCWFSHDFYCLILAKNHMVTKRNLEHQPLQIRLILAKNHMVTKPQIHVTIYLKIIKY